MRTLQKTPSNRRASGPAVFLCAWRRLCTALHDDRLMIPLICALIGLVLIVAIHYANTPAPGATS